MQDIQTTIEQAWDHRADITPANVADDVRDAVNQVIALLDSGQARVAEPVGDEWQVNQWLKKAVLLSFRIRDNKMISSPDARYYDKVPGKFDHYTEDDFKQGGFRVVPSAAVRQGVGIGGVLEPLQAGPTIIEDNCFIGARSEVVEGVIVGHGSVISMGVYIGQSTRIYDRETEEVSYGYIPPGSVVVSGNLPAKDGSHSLYCAVIVKKVDERTLSKVGINELLRSI